MGSIADVFDFFELQLPGIIERLSAERIPGLQVALVIKQATEVYIATFPSLAPICECDEFLVPIILPAFTNECDGVKLKVCKELAQSTLASYLSVIEGNARAVLEQMDKASNKVYQSLAEIKLAQGMDVDTVIDQIEGEYCLTPTELNNLCVYLESL